MGVAEGGSEATEVYVRGKCDKDGCVPCVNESPLHRWFPAGVVSFFEICIGLT